jgi:hypothetical protein
MGGRTLTPETHYMVIQRKGDTIEYFNAQIPCNPELNGNFFKLTPTRIECTSSMQYDVVDMLGSLPDDVNPELLGLIFAWFVHNKDHYNACAYRKLVNWGNSYVKRDYRYIYEEDDKVPKAYFSTNKGVYIVKLTSRYANKTPYKAIIIQHGDNILLERPYDGEPMTFFKCVTVCFTIAKRQGAIKSEEQEDF